MSRADQRVRLLITKNAPRFWSWHIFVGTSPIAAGASDNSFVSKRDAQAAGKVAVRRFVARQQDQRALDRYSSLQRGTPALDRQVRFFVGKRIDRLLRAAARCQGVHLRGDLVRMAERWMQEEPGAKYRPGEIDGERDRAPYVGPAAIPLPDRKWQDARRSASQGANSPVTEEQ